MPTAPHDYVDMFLAPVALRIDQRLEQFARLDRDDLHKRIVLETNSEADDRTRRARDVVESVTHLLDLHGWHTSWDDRGLRLSHGPHNLVLGAPPNITAYIEELPSAE